MAGGDTVASLAIAVADQGRVLTRHLDECAAENRRTQEGIRDLKDGHKEILDRFEDLNKAAWKAISGMGLIVFSAVVTILVSQYLTHSDTATKADVAHFSEHGH